MERKRVPQKKNSSARTEVKYFRMEIDQVRPSQR